MLRAHHVVRLLSVILFTACQDSCRKTPTDADGGTNGNANTDAVPVMVSITPLDTTVPLNASFPYRVVVTNAKGATISNATVTWTRSAPSVVTISSAGVVSAVSPGSSTVAATAANGVSGSATIRVLVPVATVTVTRPAVSLPLDASGQFTATLKDSTGATLTGRVVTWSSSDPTIASVNSTGRVTALKPGIVVITATSEGKSGSSQIVIDFSTLPVASFTVTPSTLRIQTGTWESFEVNAVDVNGRSVGNTAYTITIADTNTVGKDYLGKRAGTTTATVTIGTRSVTFSIQVQDDAVAVEGPSLAAGLRHACAIDGNDAAWCWGENGGQLGNGTFTNPFNTVPVSGGLSFAMITAGRVHTCALTRAGAAYCWGDNTYGQLGRPLTTTVSNVPLLVPGVPALFRLATYSDHTCGLSASGQAWCWGLNGSGQLGDNSRATRATPAAITSALRFVAIAVGSAHTCGISRGGGQAYCWGANSSAQLGDGTTTERLAPTPVSGSGSYALLFAGASSTCATATIGSFFCWGWNAFPRDYGSGMRSIPTYNTGFSGSGAFQASLTSLVNCSSSMIWCWGDPQFRNFGAANATSDNSESSPEVGVGNIGVALGGEQFGCRLKAFGFNTNRGIIACWGVSNFGTAIGTAPPLYRGAANSWR